MDCRSNQVSGMTDFGGTGAGSGDPEPVTGLLSGGAGKSAPSAFSDGAAGQSACAPPALLGIGGAPAGGNAASLPRMMGKPFLALPITTTFELGGCGNVSVAAMPCILASLSRPRR